MHAWESIQLTINYIEEHLEDEVDIAYLADMAALSPFYYQRLFKRLVTKPVAEYARLRRMAKASEILLASDARILDIALELGFQSHEHFTRTFKRVFGLTPEAYRANPVALNRMTKPELLLNYALVDEGVPLVTDGIVLEINSRRLEEPVIFAGLKMRLAFEQLGGMGTESGVDPLDALWNDFHARKRELGLNEDAEEAGVLMPCEEPGKCDYFAGGRAPQSVAMNGAAMNGVAMNGAAANGSCVWTLPAGEYIVCAFEAENFEALVMDANYKAQKYLFDMWLKRHNISTEPFCAERYADHDSATTCMEVWVKRADNIK